MAKRLGKKRVTQKMEGLVLKLQKSVNMCIGISPAMGSVNLVTLQYLIGKGNMSIV